MKKTYYKFIITLSLVSLLFSCKKVIELDLRKGIQQVVIEGEITNAAPPYIINLSRTGSFNDLTISPIIDDALVIIKDNLGIIDTLKYLEKGKYETQKIIGFPGNTYTLIVSLHDTNYTAISTMPEFTSFDSLLIELSAGFGGSEFKRITPKFQDKESVRNFYQFRLYSNDSLSVPNVLFDDALNDGKVNTRPFFAKLVKGATATVEMRCYDLKAYTYQYGLNQIEQNGQNQSASPANPTNNITGGKALGFFSANTYAFKEMLVTF